MSEPRECDVSVVKESVSGVESTENRKTGLDVDIDRPTPGTSNMST